MLQITAHRVLWQVLEFKLLQYKGILNVKEVGERSMKVVLHR